MQGALYNMQLFKGKTIAKIRVQGKRPTLTVKLTGRYLKYMDLVDFVMLLKLSKTLANKVGICIYEMNE